jgi:3'-phosphoadenosine 5'-phosphosulfate sulfotransferase (PAPS reductase)/FAD synthetase
MNNVVSLSGGKDSTAMLLMMLERGKPIHSVVWFDTGWEFPEMHEHIDKLERYIGFEFVRLKPEKSFHYWMMERPVVSKKGENKGLVHRIGGGWPSPMRRWCTRQKADAIGKYCKQINDVVQCIGYAADEPNRNLSKSQFNYRFPLQEYDITEQQALAYCIRHGFNWGGLYEIFNRVSCFCCPLQRISELKKLRWHYPELWAKMLKWDGEMPDNRGFRGYETVHDLERRFAAEDRRTFPQFLPGRMERRVND